MWLIIDPILTLKLGFCDQQWKQQQKQQQQQLQHSIYYWPDFDQTLMEGFWDKTTTSSSLLTTTKATTTTPTTTSTTTTFLGCDSI